MKLHFDGIHHKFVLEVCWHWNGFYFALLNLKNIIFVCIRTYYFLPPWWFSSSGGKLWWHELSQCLLDMSMRLNLLAKYRLLWPFSGPLACNCQQSCSGEKGSGKRTKEMSKKWLNEQFKNWRLFGGHWEWGNIGVVKINKIWVETHWHNQLSKGGIPLLWYALILKMYS